MEAERVGSRLRKLRKLRGVTQHQLAGQTHFSVSLIKKVEQGGVPPSSAFVAVSAGALGVAVASLYGTDDGRQMAEESPRVQLDDLRTALEAWDDPRPEGQPLDIAAIDRQLDLINRQITGTRYADAAVELAPFNTRHHPAVRETVFGYGGIGPAHNRFLGRLRSLGRRQPVAEANAHRPFWTMGLATKSGAAAGVRSPRR